MIAGLEKASGTRVGSELATYYEGEITHGRLYPDLNTIVDEGLAEEGQHNRRTNYYRLTAAGEQALHARREWETQYVDR